MKQKNALKLTSPARYRIRIQGYLDNSWANRLGELTFTNHLSSKQVVVTVLTGRLIDQGELLGVLNHLYNLGFPLLSVECLESGKYITEKKGSGFNDGSYDRTQI